MVGAPQLAHALAVAQLPPPEPVPEGSRRLESLRVDEIHLPKKFKMDEDDEDIV